MNPFTSLLRRFVRSSPTVRRPIRRRLALERLEDRAVPATWQSFDGTGNNLAHPDWGSAGVDLLRRTAAAYADGLSSPAGANRPSARAISNALADQPDDTPTNDRLMSAFVYAWGQFIDHDLDLTTSATPREAFSIAVPTGDPEFDPNGTGTQIIPLSRSQYDPTTGSTNARQQVNSITAWLDASMVYGSDAATAAKLRTMSGGHMKIGADGLLPDEGAGDIRALENPDLESLQVLFLREHNRIADALAKANPKLTDEELYQQARRQVIAEIQSITFNEFLPALLGNAAPRPYAGYKANVNPGIATEFSTAAFRVGHTLVGDDVEFLDNDGNEVHEPLSLRDGFFNPTVLRQTGIDPVLKYLASDHAQEVDLKVIDDLRNFLFGQPGAGGLDLAALNIQRGRDHGLADYNSTRAAYGLPRVTSFAQITSNQEVQQALQQLYGNVNNIDLWVGGLAEDHLAGSSVGATFARIIGDQFQRVRDGDRFWYQNQFRGAELRRLEGTTLADVIRRNTTVSNLQDNVFFFRASISGQVFADLNGDGRRNGPERGLGGRTVELLDEEGAVVASAVTRADGSYRFEGLELGNYRVREVLPPGATATGRAPMPIAITRGMTVAGIDLGEVPPRGQRSQPQAGGFTLLAPSDDFSGGLTLPRRRG